MTSYRATYRRYTGPYNDVSLAFRDFIAPDFLSAVDAAEAAREDNEQLLNVRSPEQLDPIVVVHA